MFESTLQGMFGDKQIGQQHVPSVRMVPYRFPNSEAGSVTWRVGEAPQGLTPPYMLCLLIYLPFLSLGVSASHVY